MDKITIDFLGVYTKKENMQNEFMHACDVFEQSKQLAKHEQIRISTTHLESTLVKIHHVLKKGVESEGGYTIFIGVSSINDKKYNDKNCFFKPGVRTLSMVQNNSLGWAPFKDILTQLGYDVITDQTMIVTKVN